MNLSTALRHLTKVYGKRVAIQDGKRPSSDAQREDARIKRNAANEIKKTAAAALDARREAILAADAEYRRLLAEFHAARKAQDAAGGWSYHRYTAGVDNGMFFVVKVEADNLDELVAKAREKAAA